MVVHKLYKLNSNLKMFHSFATQMNIKKLKNQR